MISDCVPDLIELKLNQHHENSLYYSEAKAHIATENPLDQI